MLTKEWGWVPIVPPILSVQEYLLLVSGGLSIPPLDFKGPSTHNHSIPKMTRTERSSILISISQFLHFRGPKHLYFEVY